MLIVGGVAGGASTATRLRRMNELADIIIFEKGKYISYANCGLPYYIGGTIPEREMLLVQTPEKMKEMFNIDIRIEQEVVKISPKTKSITIEKVTTGETYEENYDFLVLSPGATPIKPPIPGIEDPRIFTIRAIPEIDALKTYITDNSINHAVIIGGGFIGLEMAENLHTRGLKVSIVEKSEQVMTSLDYEMATLVHGHILAKGVHLYLQDGLKEFQNKGKHTEVVLESGKRLQADLVILAIGVKPDIEFIKEAGLELGEKGGIKVNSNLQTSDPNIYALGDAVEIEDFTHGSKSLVPLAGPANKQGRIVANNIVGKKETYNGTQGTAIVKVFELTVASTGSNEQALKNKGLKFHSIICHSKSHAGYYPGALPMTIKLIFSPEGIILGAQIVGYEGVDKRIDVIATSLRFKKTIYDLTELELAYAPPYSAAKDPVNMAGFIASNLLDGVMDVCYWQELEKTDFNKTIILDIGEKVERDLGYIEGSIHIPLGNLREKTNELSTDKEIIIYCQVGLRSYIASRILTQRGFNKIRVLSGGFKHYNTIMQTKHNLENQNYEYGESSLDYADLNKQEIYNTETGNVNPEYAATGEIIKLNACGLSCPGPIVQVYKKMVELKEGNTLEVTASDPGFLADIKAWCQKTGNTLLETKSEHNNFKALIKKGIASTIDTETRAGKMEYAPPQNKTIIVFSGELDKAIASFIIANGAAAMGRKITMFFTFWGLNVLRKDTVVDVEKEFMGKMFGGMMPRGSRKLKLSNMNMLGIGPKLIRGIMKAKNISSLEELIEQAMANGVKLMACNMSMDVMGIKKEELIDGVDIGGVAAYLGEAEDSNVNLFI